MKICRADVWNSHPTSGNTVCVSKRTRESPVGVEWIIGNGYFYGVVNRFKFHCLRV